VTVDSIASLQRIQGTFDQLAGAASTTSSDTFAKLIAALTAPEETQLPTTVHSASTATGSGIVAAAEKYEGVPYVFGGTSATGIDCTGLVQKALGDAGISVGRSMDEQMTAGTEVASLAEAKPGDLIVLDGGAHIVIYSGDGNVIHAPYEGRTVTEQKAWFDDSAIVTIRRVAPEATASTVQAGTLSGATSSTFGDALQALINAQAAILSRSITL